MEEELKDCPFCGGKPKLSEIGNNATRKRSVEIKCSVCYAKRVDAALLRERGRRGDGVSTECFIASGTEGDTPQQ